MKLAIAQLNPIIGDLTGNAQQILDAAKIAAARGVSLLLTPELSLCGYPPRDLLLNPSFVESMATTLAQLASELPPSLAVLVGTVTPNPHALVAGGKPLFNTIALLKSGKVQQIFYKRLLPTYDVFDENRYFESGHESNSFTIEDGGIGEVGAKESFSLSPHSPIKIGVTICEDLWNDEEFWGKRSYQVNPLADLAREGVDLLVNLSASPYSLGKQKLREAMLQHSAKRYQTPILYANQLGGNDDLIFDGSSVAFNSAGEIVCRARAFETDLVIVEFDEVRKDLVSGSIAPAPDGEEAQIWQALVLGVRDYGKKCGFKKVVLGLSGGIDSALVAAIATAALGADNVLGILMPSPYSSAHSIADALALAQNLGIETHTLRIGDLMAGYDRTLAPLFTGTEFGIAEENIQSRIRGNLLMAIANKFGYLLLSTGNKSEMAVGYCTLYGDMNGGLAVISDVPKTRVYSLCQWLNSGRLGNEGMGNISNRQIIPENILHKPPSAELKPGQVDQDSLPPYDILDDILYRVINQHQSASQIMAAGYDSTVVNQVLRLVARAEFKRKQAPPGLKVTDCAFGTGWRMPIACRRY
ncbi:MAG TPA: NAD+ synthase [Cyanobacteria bacterium UBA11149]|nr:NAD+ synthase [Cyanobacteria bacterium UBA11367]HBE60893.1 NAD+ synthase [Cyanobacteria bacterium UBA11366]HBK63422.1 NAD+ synthase [Cyanobacteria bacterium UBA11166]HBR72150.1 NAD+ synthase [Cyanobacteria bacterium UBA11159]HBS68486.1 NAD+ synthase [Cyanobacteria bacterium UBA11153]HBW88597.1 NAD+ synthase [Cyanobacteria bacterium UBA11149]HCA97413.1 NAD+ synthase [Cyanobacteria bacterium UBA9226]